MNTITPDIELEFSPGVWTSMRAPGGDATKAYLDQQSRVRFGPRGVGSDRKPVMSSMSFTLDNADETWTPGNTSSAYYTKLKKGIGVRLSSTFSGNTIYRFRGVVTDIQPYFAEYGPAKNRVEITCQGIESQVRLFSMPLQENVDVDGVLQAMMDGAGSSLYSFEDSNYVIPYAYAKGDLLSALFDAAASEMGGLLFPDGQGRWRNRKVENMISGYASPDHTWGSTITPEGAIEPDYRNDSQVARITVRAGRLRPTTEVGTIFKLPLNKDAGAAEPLAAFSARRYRVRFDEPPTLIFQQATSGTVDYTDSGDDLWATIAINSTTLQTQSSAVQPTTFRPGMMIRIENEVMVVTAVSWPASFRQLLTVSRGELGTSPAAHITGTGSRVMPIFIRNFTPISTSIGKAGSGFSATTANPTIIGNDVANLVSGDLISSSVTGEKMLVTGSPTPGVGLAEYTVPVTRGVNGTTAKVVVAGTNINREGIDYGAALGQYGIDVRASDNPSGLPSEVGDVVALPSFTGGAALSWSGLVGVFDLYNQAAGTRYVSDVEIKASYVKVEDTPLVFSIEQAIPYILGIPEGSEVTVPFGASDYRLVKCFAAGLLRGARVPSPWLTVTFTENLEDNTSSIRSAEVGQLVRYTGTGTNREKIDDWYRIMSVSGAIDDADLWHLTYVLAPAHLGVFPARTWFTTFTWQDADGAVGLGVFDCVPPGSAGWTQDGDWTVIAPPGSAAPTGVAASALPLPNRATAVGINAPTPGLVNVGQADMKVAAGVALGPAIDNTYPANTGGVGVFFRCSSNGSQYWWAYFNPTSSEVILGNSSAGVVARTAWTPDSARVPEIEVRAMSTRIQVFVDAAGEPLITVTSSTFSGNTWAGPCFNRTIVTTGTTYPGFNWFAPQAV